MPEHQARTQYDHMAAFYDRLWHTYVQRTVALLHTWAAPPPPARVLDVACGTGAFAALVAQAQPTQRMLGIDIAPEMLARARQKCRAFPAMQFAQARADRLPCATGCYDVVVSASAFHYFDDPRAALAEMRRAITATGRLTILDWCKDFSLCYLLDLALQRLDPAHAHCYYEAELHALLRQAGFSIVRARRVRVGLVWGLMIATAVPV